MYQAGRENTRDIPLTNGGFLPRFGRQFFSLNLSGELRSAGRGTLPPSADGESPAEVQRKTLRPERANPPAAVRVPRTIGAEKEPPCRGEPASGSSSAPVSRCRERSRPVRANTLTRFECPAQSVQKNFSKIFKKLTILGQFSPPSGIGLKEVTQ